MISHRLAQTVLAQTVTFMILVGLFNLFDEYHEYVYDLTMDGSDTIHSAGDGRNYSVSVRFEL